MASNNGPTGGGSTNDQCPECGGRVTTSRIEAVCQDCGAVVESQPIDHGPERRYPDEGETNQKRTGAPLTPSRHDRGLSTRIGRSTDANGNSISGRKRRRLSRMRRLHGRSRWRSKRERNLAHGLGEIRRITARLGLGESVRDQASRLFTEAQDADLLHGRSIESFAAASVYGTLRCTGLSWTDADVAAIAQCDPSSLQNAYTVLNRELGLPTQPVLPSGFIPRFASELDVPDVVRRRARELAERAEAEGVVNGAQPTGFAAGCLYAAGRELGYRIEQRTLAEVAGSSEVTVRTHWQTVAELDV